MKLPILKLVKPADLANKTPGKLPPELLTALPGGGKLHHLAAKAWFAMVEHAKAVNIELKPTSSADTYRSYDMQLAGFKQRYTLKNTGTGKTRHFEGKTWYLKRKMAPLAAPGTSNHNLGLAVDVSNANGPRLKWLVENEHLFGFSHELQEEPWHIRLVTGDAITPLVQDWIDRQAPKA
jgi:LAS superfamily LD-carboxypeptidase LdcB